MKLVPRFLCLLVVKRYPHLQSMHCARRNNLPFNSIIKAANGRIGSKASAFGILLADDKPVQFRDDFAGG